MLDARSDDLQSRIDAVKLDAKTKRKALELRIEMLERTIYKHRSTVQFLPHLSFKFVFANIVA